VTQKVWEFQLLYSNFISLPCLLCVNALILLHDAYGKWYKVEGFIVLLLNLNFFTEQLTYLQSVIDFMYLYLYVSGMRKWESQVQIFCIVTPCSVMIGYQHLGEPCCFHLQGGDGDGMVLWNIGTLLQHYMVSQPRRPQLESSPPWIPQILWQTVVVHVQIFVYVFTFTCLVFLVTYRWNITECSFFIIPYNELISIGCSLVVTIYSKLFVLIERETKHEWLKAWVFWDHLIFNSYFCITNSE
jgi:hypothetical protein